MNQIQTNFEFKTDGRPESSKIKAMIKFINQKKDEIKSGDNPKTVALQLVQNIADSNIKSLTPELIDALFTCSEDVDFRFSLSQALVVFVITGLPIQSNEYMKFIKAEFDKSLTKYIEYTPTFDQNQAKELIDYLIDSKTKFTYDNLFKIYLKLIASGTISRESAATVILQSLEKLSYDKSFTLNILNTNLSRYKLFRFDLTTVETIYDNFIKESIKNKSLDPEQTQHHNYFCLKMICKMICVLNDIENDEGKKSEADKLQKFSEAILYDIENNLNNTIDSILDMKNLDIDSYMAEIEEQKKQNAIDSPHTVEQVDEAQTIPNEIGHQISENEKSNLKYESKNIIDIATENNECLCNHNENIEIKNQNKKDSETTNESMSVSSKQEKTQTETAAKTEQKNCSKMKFYSSEVVKTTINNESKNPNEKDQKTTGESVSISSEKIEQKTQVNNTEESDETTLDSLKIKPETSNEEYNIGFNVFFTIMTLAATVTTIVFSAGLAAIIGSAVCTLILTVITCCKIVCSKQETKKSSPQLNQNLENDSEGQAEIKVSLLEKGENVKSSQDKKNIDSKELTQDKLENTNKEMGRTN